MNPYAEVARKARELVNLWRLRPHPTPDAIAEHMTRLAGALAALEEALQALDAQRRADDDDARFYRPVSEVRT